MQADLGMRVVRGPDWIWNEQDGEEGMIGTIVKVKAEGSSASQGRVKVLWDHGGQGLYRCGETNSYDLLVYGATFASKHGVGCEVCLKDVIGTRWACKECPLTNLCTYCYMNDKHNIQHCFERFESSELPGVLLNARAKSLKIESKGFFPGALVVRGPCWKWDDQDGGNGQVGKVQEIQEFQSQYKRNVARVQWLGNSVSNVYRIGQNGQVDLKCVMAASGGPYYKQHLPLVANNAGFVTSNKQQANINSAMAAQNFPVDVLPAGSNLFQQDVVESANNFQAKDKFQQQMNVLQNDEIQPEGDANPINASAASKFSIGDRVRMVPPSDSCIAMQSGHGGWHPSMEEDICRIGIVQSITEKNDVTVAFNDGNKKWTLNPKMLKKVLRRDELKEGDSVRTISNINAAKGFYETEVKEWTDDLNCCLGQIGKITKIYLDGNIRVAIGQNSLIVPIDIIEEKVMQIDDSSAKKEVVVNQEVKLIKAAKVGDMTEIKKILDKNPHEVNTPSLEGTPLTAAIFEEREDVVTYLMNKGADINILDKSKHTALHLALSVDNEAIIKAVMSSDLLDIGILSGKSNFDYLQFAAVCGSLTGTKLLLQKFPNIINRPSSGPTPLHYAVISSVELVDYLINEAGFDTNVRDLDQRTPLHVAIMTNNLQSAVHLVEAGADVNLADYRGTTPLHMVTSLQERHSLKDHSWYAMVLKRLVGKKSQLRKENKEVVAKLVNVLNLKRDDYVADAIFGCFLVKKGADPYIKNSNKQSPFSASSRCEVVDVIRKYFEMIHNKNNASGNSSNKGMPLSLSSDDSYGNDDCRLCRESSCDVKFQPCGHSVTCSDCAIYFCKCFICEEQVASFTKKTYVTDCLICDENVADVLFEPCKHIVCCSGCAWRMARCVHCKAGIEKKLDKNLQPIAPPNDPESAKYDDLLVSLKSLEAKVREIESMNTCTICMDRPKNVMFLCGHGTCDVCSPSLELCPICRDPIEKKIPMFQ